MRVLYPQAAMDGFCIGVGHQLGVKIACKAGQPCTDGRTVYLPPIQGYLDADGFRAYCGVALHEAAHCWQGTVDRHVAYANGDPFKAMCYNAVADIADETRLERFMPVAKDLFYASNKSCCDKIVAGNSLATGDPVWAVLAVAILNCRKGCSREFVRQAKAHPHIQLMGKARKILSKCRTSNLCKRKNRRWADWHKMYKAANELVELLKHLKPPPADSGQMGDGPAGAGIPEAAMAGAGNQPMPGDAVADDGDGQRIAQNYRPMQSAPKPAQGQTIPVDPNSVQGKIDAEAAKQEAEWMAARQAKRAEEARKKALAKIFDETVYRQMGPVFRSIVEKISQAQDADGAEDGYQSGPRLGRDLTRVAIDRRCFVRRNGEGEKISVAVILDVSGSMEDKSGAVAAVAQSFLDAVRPIAESVDTAIFSNETIEQPGFRDLSKAEWSNTFTDRALNWAAKKLQGKRGRRVVVMVTDGEANEPADTQAACQKLVRSGVTVLGISYQHKAEDIIESMPGASIAQADTIPELGMRLARAAAKIARK